MDFSADYSVTIPILTQPWRQMSSVSAHSLIFARPSQSGYEREGVNTDGSLVVISPYSRPNTETELVETYQLHLHGAGAPTHTDVY